MRPLCPAATTLDTFVAEMLSEFPRFRVVYKRNSEFSKLIGRVLRVLTLNQMRTYQTHYHTVIGDTLYVPDSWDDMDSLEKVILLRHERVHLRQRRRFTFVGMAFIYLVPWFPMGLAYGRARLEWEAYTETLRATYELIGADAAESRALRKHIIDRFTGPDYGWMWPFPRQLNQWYDLALDQLRAAARLNGVASHKPGSSQTAN